jgi:hypothetical protein
MSINRTYIFQIKQFLSQLIHEPIRFGGHDLYTIDYGLLRTVKVVIASGSKNKLISYFSQMIAGITTYMIIFIQMSPGRND